MAKGLDTLISDLSAPWNGIAGRRVREFIQLQLSNLSSDKVGYMRILPQKGADGYYHLECFASLDAAVAFDNGDAGSARLFDIAIPILEMEEGTTFPLSLTTNSRQAIVSIDGHVEVLVKFESYRKDPGSQAVDNDVTGTLVIQGRRNASSNWQERATRPIASNNADYQTIDISDCVDADVKDYQIRMYVQVNDDTVSGTTQAVTWQSITKTSLRLEYASDWAIPVRGNTYTPEFRIYGVVNKTLNVKITNPNGDSIVRSTVVGDGEYVVQSFNQFSFADLSDFKMLSRHGVSSVESWLSVTGDDSKQSAHIFNQVMVVADTSDSTPYLMVQDISPSERLTVQNYVGGQLFRYAIYNPSGNDLPLEFRLTNYGGDAVYAAYPADNPRSGSQYAFTNTVEVEDVADSEFVAMLRAWSGSSPMSLSYALLVDNSLNYSPKKGADFILNPRLRSNSESNPARIINAADGSDTGATMTGFAFGDIDGWTNDGNGNKCLLIPAGRHISIPYDLFRSNRERGSNVSWSVELDFATRNVIDEDTPIFRIANNDLTKGIIIRALEGVVYTSSQATYDQQSFAWQENSRTHVVINVLHDLKPNASIGKSIAVCRTFVNGVINREFSFSTQLSDEWYTPNQGNTIEMGIDDADLVLYNLRIYANSSAVILSSADAQQNYISSLPTVEQKNSERERNDIMQQGAITLARVLEKGLNAWVFRGRINSKANAASGGTTDTENNRGDLKLWIHDDNGVLIPECSGVINDTEHKNQGTTANSYAEHNQQDKFSDDSVFTDLNGVEHSGYPIDPNAPEATKLVVKINWASPMQSHKQGATSLYNDLYRRMCASDKQMLQDNPKARVAVWEKPVYMFEENPDTGETRFLGLGTFGPGKMDKPTWGYNDTLYPEFCMVEGSDNNLTLTDMRCPWDNSVIYNPDSEAYFKAGLKSIGFSTGKTSKVNGKKYPTDAVMQPVKDAWLFLYSCNPFIRHYEGTLESLMSDPVVNTVYQYWLTSGEHRYEVYRFNETSDDAGSWVPAGINGATVSIADIAAGLTDYNDITKAIITARARTFKDAIDSHRYVYKNDLLFNRCFLKLFAGTDNQSKNTYYCAVKSTSNDTLIALHADDLDTIMKTDNVSLSTKPYYIEERDLMPDGVKYYWEGQFNVLAMLTDLAYSGLADRFNIGGVEIAGIDPDESLRSTMNAMLVEMGNLVSRPGLSKDAKGCIEQYFFSIQEYFCPTAYNETARLRYESNQALYESGFNGLLGSRGTEPLVQSMGDQLQSERQYVARRLAYISSWCNYGEFGNTAASSSAWIFPVTSNALGSEIGVDIRLTLTPHQWLYPSGKQGSSLVRSNIRMQPGRQYLFTLAENVRISSDTEFALCGIDYYRSLGNLGDMPIGTTDKSLNVSGRRLVEFIANPSDPSRPQFRPQSISFSSGFSMLKTISLNGCSATGGSLDCSGSARLSTIDVSNTLITGVQFPKTSTLTEAHLSANTTSVEIDGLISLRALTLQGYSRLTSFKLRGRYAIDSYQQAQSIYDAKPDALADIQMDNVNWVGCRKALLMWMAQHGAKITGYINMSNEDGAINFPDKIILGRAFGNIDSDSGLRINYVRSAIPADGLSIKCTGFMNEVGREYIVEPGAKNTINNDFALREDGEIDATVTLDANAYNYATLVNEKYIRVKTLQAMGSETRYTLTVSVRKIDGSVVSASRTVAFCKRIPQLGDFAYIDGTFDDTYTEAIPLAGIVFDVRQDNTAANETYIARVVSIVDADSARTWGPWTGSWSATVRAEIGSAFWDLQELSNYSNQSPSNPSSYFNDGISLSGAALDEKGASNTAIIVNMAKRLFDSYVKQLDPTMVFPTCISAPAGSNEVQIADVNTRLVSITGNNNANQLLYPAALYCYLFQPKGDNVHEQYTKNKWFLPAAGELMRLMYYVGRGTTADSYSQDEGLKTAIFARAAQRAGKTIITFATSDFWSSTEQGEQIAYRSSRTASSGGYKNGTYVARPVAAFRFEL